MKQLLLLLTILCAVPVFSQDYDELKLFQTAAGQASTLYRGIEGTKYNVLFNGTYYWDRDEFKRGDVFFDGKLYRDVFLNIDACSQTAIVSYNLSSGLMALDTRKVLYLVIDGKRYENLKLYGHDEMPEGFYQKICDKNVTAYKRVNKMLRSTYESANGVHFIGYSDPDYKTNVLDYFYYDPSYYLVREDGTIIEIKSVNTLLKEYPSRKADIKRYCQDHKSAVGRVSENKIVSALECLEK